MTLPAAPSSPSPFARVPLTRSDSTNDWNEVVADLNGYSAAGSDEQRLRYLVAFGQLAPTWSPWSLARDRRPTFEIRDGGPREDGFADLVANESCALGGEADTRIGSEAVVRESRRRELVIAGGAALFQVRLALEAFGERFTVEEFPQGEAGSKLARVMLDGRTEPSAIALRTLSAALRYSAPHEPFRNEMVPAAAAKALLNECRRERVGFRVLVGNERDALARIVMGAAGSKMDDARLTAAAPFCCVVTTEGNTRRDWLAAGQAMAAIYARGTAQGLGLTLMTAPIEDGSARKDLARVMRTDRTPQLLFRMGPI